MAGTIRKSPVRQVPLSELKDDLSRFLREAEKHEIPAMESRPEC
jgi:hypothetical protein